MSGYLVKSKNMEETFKSGAVPDTRTEKEREGDYKFKEVVASVAPVDWKEKPQTEWRKFPIFNQDGSGSCVAQTQAKELGIMRFLKDGVYVHFSASDIYQRRANKPGAGMGSADVRAVVKRGGATLEVLSPSQGMTDEQMDSVIVEDYKRKVGEVFKVPNYIELPSADIEAIASVIQTTKKGVMVWFYFKIDEWTEHPVIKYPGMGLYDDGVARHSITAVDYTLVNGKKCLIIEDSWGTAYGMAGQRVIDEDFFRARNFYAGYLVNFSFDVSPTEKPHHTFFTDMEFGQTSGEVKWLQDCLKYEGLFPANASSTGYFGAITRKSVRDFQDKHGVTTPSNPGYGKVGPLTRGFLNDIYGQ